LRLEDRTIIKDIATKFNREILISLERWPHEIRRTMVVARKREEEEKEEVKIEEVRTTEKK
jgi:hypothetical protein